MDITQRTIAKVESLRMGTQFFLNIKAIKGE